MSLLKWAVACNGEEPVLYYDGKEYQLLQNTETKEKNYYCYDDKMFLNKNNLESFPPPLRLFC